jgi:hypothetical protein
VIGLRTRARVPTVPTGLDKGRTGVDAAVVACLLVGCGETSRPLRDHARLRMQAHSRG